jgi:predicted ATPase
VESPVFVGNRQGRLMLYQAMATITRGWALIERGRQDEAIEQIRQGLAAHQATGTESIRPHLSALLVEALGKGRKADEGLRVLEEALAVGDGNGERYYQAELYRLKGELLLQQSAGRGVSRAATGGKAVVEAERPAVANAERCFHQAMKIA